MIYVIELVDFSRIRAALELLGCRSWGGWSMQYLSSGGLAPLNAEYSILRTGVCRRQNSRKARLVILSLSVNLSLVASQGDRHLHLSLSLPTAYPPHDPPQQGNKTLPFQLVLTVDMAGRRSGRAAARRAAAALGKQLADSLLPCHLSSL